ncbi:MAG: hypothetical protein HMLKMBBP_01276 [Planctomycetes bacterium]|nr:hypothetical protein [Planctomycetota bacterium]
MTKTSENAAASRTDLGSRIVRGLLSLRAAGALELRETAPGRGIFRTGFRAAGWPVSMDVDASVLEIRVYHSRDEVAMSRVSGTVLDQILGRSPVPAGTPKDAAAAWSELRAVVADWKRDNPRLFIRPPEKAGHPDNWNRA